MEPETHNAETIATKSANWIQSEYFRSLTNHTSDGLTYFNNLISWSNSLVLVTAIGAILTFATAQKTIDYSAVGIVSSFLLIFVQYLAYRAARGYCNLLRFSSLQKDIAACAMEQSWDQNLARIQENIKAFHIGWTSPLSPWSVFWKIWLSAGFLFHLTLASALLAFSIYKSGWSCMWSITLLILGILSITLAYTFFFNSRYFRKWKKYSIAVDQR